MAAALYACCILREMADQSHDSKEVEALEENANSFEQLAIDLLAQFYETDRDLSHQMLTRSVSVLNGRTCLQIATAAHAIRFVSQSSCLTLLEVVWYGQVLPTNHIWHILLAIIFPPILWTLQYRRKEEIKELTATFSGEVSPN